MMTVVLMLNANVVINILGKIKSQSSSSSSSPSLTLITTIGITVNVVIQNTVVANIILLSLNLYHHQP